jgi:hypothetical protein
MAELSVRRKPSSSSSTGTRQFGFTAAKGSFMCSPVNRSTTCNSAGMPCSWMNITTGRLTVDAGW